MKRIVGGFVLAILFSPPLFSLPLASAEIQDSPCALESYLTTLEQIQSDFSLPYFQALTKELEARKQALDAIVACSSGEIHDLKARLTELTIQEEGPRYLQGQLLNDLNQTLEYHTFQRKHIVDLGLHGTKEFARTFLTWRATTYRFVVERINSFILWTKNEKLLGVGQSRLGLIRQTVKTLTLIDQEIIQTQFKNAEQQFKDATRAHAEARRSLERGMPINESLVFLKSSLESLSEMYQTFSDLSESVKKIPLP